LLSYDIRRSRSLAHAVTLGTPKGGAGKTTALLSTANAAMLRNPNARIALVDTDATVGSLRSFMSRRAERDVDRNLRLWSVSANDGAGRLADTFQRASDWADYVLVDVHGGVSAFNVAIAEISDIVIFPTRISLALMKSADRNERSAFPAARRARITCSRGGGVQ
jgi:cellulose biosynthesis protein BcsQ